jgi:group II intron reverse transcriptase/maturase
MVNGGLGKRFVIPEGLLREAWWRVEEKGKSAGVDGVTTEQFAERLEDNLRVLWDRMSLGSYFPGPVRVLDVAMKDGPGRLGIPNVVDRVAQTAAVMALEDGVEGVFHEDSYGYRPGRSSLDAIAVCRERCRRKAWVLDVGIRDFFDSVPWDLTLEALARHTDQEWVVEYVRRWLEAPMLLADGRLVSRDKGTPQGSPISPLIANLFLHDVLDTWMTRELPGVEFERFADDLVVHCVSERQAGDVCISLACRLADAGLELHPGKTRIVYCQNSERPGAYEHVSFTFCGYVFPPRKAKSGRRGAGLGGAVDHPGELKEGRSRASQHRPGGKSMTTLKAFAKRAKLLPGIVSLLVAVLAYAPAPAMAEFGVSKFRIAATNENGTPDLQAGSHPYALTTALQLNLPSEGGKVLEGEIKDVTVELPPGLIGNPAATPRCTAREFTAVEELKGETCPIDTAIGVETSYLDTLEEEFQPFSTPVYNLVPPKGVAAEFGFVAAKRTPVLLLSQVKAGTDYSVTTDVPDIAQSAAIVASKVTLWGVPGEASHNPWRGTCEKEVNGKGLTSLEAVGRGLRENEIEREGPDYLASNPTIGLPESDGHCESQHAPLPLLTNPTSCGVSRTAAISVDDWEEPGNFEGDRKAQASLPALTGCEKLAASFRPSIETKPDRTSGSSPTGMDVNVVVPQEGTESPSALADAAVKDTSLTLPAGMQLNPSAADGLQACSSSQIGFERFEELPAVPGVRTALFTPGAASCPEASKLADVRIKSPDLEGELEGAMYLAAPQNFAGIPENPFESLLALYLVAEEPKAGVLVKLAGKVTPDETTGQLTTSFENTPQLSFNDLEVEFPPGERAALSTPAACGTYTTTATFTPWSGTEPVTSTSSFDITSGPGGSPCTKPQPFAPSMSAGVTNANAGAFSPLTTTIGREDSDQQLGSVQVTLPKGLAAVITGVPECGEAEANAGTCSAGSLIGQSTASVGVGADPFTVTGGQVYLTGPYQGAPFGLSIVTPAVAGPFNLGYVVVRAKLEINPHSAQATVTTGEVPHILKGIPLDIKHVNVTVNRPSFTFNPTSCEPMHIETTIDSDEGASSLVSSPFQVANCANLKFTPTVAIATGAHASKADGASLSFKIAYPKGAMGTQAWVEETKFDIPKQLPARLTTIQQACPQATFATDRAACPPHSKIGTAIVHTQVLPTPLEGPVYFVSYGGAKFPDVVIPLSGDNVNIELVGETYIHNNVTSATFNELPDVPFESVEVNLPTGEYSEFGAYTSAQHPYQLCGNKLNVPTLFKAQNGLEIHQQTPVTVNGCPTTMSVMKKTLKKHTLTLSVYVPTAGKLTATASGLSSTTKTTTGQQTLTLTLHTTQPHHPKTKLHITFTPTHGHKQTKTQTTQT